MSIACPLRNAAIGCEKVNESRPVGKGHDGYDAAPGSRAPKNPIFTPLRKYARVNSRAFEYGVFHLGH